VDEVQIEGTFPDGMYGNMMIIIYPYNISYILLMIDRLIDNLRSSIPSYIIGSKLVTIQNPISSSDGNLSLALAASFLPIPTLDIYKDDIQDGLVPGEVILAQYTEIRLNVGRQQPIDLRVVNTADRPIQIGSHYHFIETNPFLQFNRRASYGMRLNM